MLPSALTLIPTYLLAVRYHLINSLWGIILPSLAGPLGIYLLRQYILGLPRELFEAARVDGASHFRTLVSIVAPLIRQPTIVLGVLTFVASWNSFIWPLLIGQTQEKMTLPVGIATGNLQFSTDTSAVLAQAVVSVVPTAILFAFLQRAFTAGITAGATKG
jgi:multiple sugar transport system permease protein